jgi:hypothetical protein
MVVLEMGSHKVFAQTGLEPQSSYLSLASSWDYRLQSLVLSQLLFLMLFTKTNMSEDDKIEVYMYLLRTSN